VTFECNHKSGRGRAIYFGYIDTSKFKKGKKEEGLVRFKALGESF